jgi:hypothetical protein
VAKLVPSVAVLLAALMTRVATNAECVTVTAPPPSKSQPPEQVAKPTLVFSGTVTAVVPDRYLVSFQVELVWSGQLRRESTFFVAPVVEGAQASSFRTGVSYLVTVFGSVQVVKAEEASLDVPVGTVLVSFGCGDGPIPLAEAKEALTRLGRGRAPTP